MSLGSTEISQAPTLGSRVSPRPSQQRVGCPFPTLCSLREGPVSSRGRGGGAQGDPCSTDALMGRGREGDACPASTPVLQHLVLEQLRGVAPAQDAAAERPGRSPEAARVSPAGGARGPAVLLRAPAQGRWGRPSGPGAASVPLPPRRSHARRPGVSAGGQGCGAWGPLWGHGRAGSPHREPQLRRGQGEEWQEGRA